MKNKKKNQVFKVLFIFLFIAYITIYTSQKSGYMDFQNYKKMSLTKEKIKEFESDIKAGKKVDLTKYSTNTTRNYSNKLSNAGFSISNGVSSLVNKGVVGLFDTIAKLAEE